MQAARRIAVLVAAFLHLCLPVFSEVGARRPEGAHVAAPPLVIAQSAADHVRFTALTVGSRMRLEILSRTGDTLFNSDFRSGNLIEWPLGDQQGSRLPDGVYGSIVTVEELSGRVTYWRGLFRVADGKVSFDAPDAAGLGTAAVNEGEEGMSILRTDDRFPFTAVGHDGTDARIESATGGLTLHAGRFFSGDPAQSPHMRLTPEGNLGIGVREPAARLDVAGLIRAEGFLFPDGTIQRTAAQILVLGVVPGTLGTVAGGAARVGTLPVLGALAQSRSVGRTRTPPPISRLQTWPTMPTRSAQESPLLREL